MLGTARGFIMNSSQFIFTCSSSYLMSSSKSQASILFWSNHVLCLTTSSF